jgi:thiamine-phosphate pyrophosphorylase
VNPREQVHQRVRGLYGLADAAGAGGDPERLATQLISGGCRLIQLRCKGWRADDRLRVAVAIQRRCRDSGVTFIVNDHPDLAAEVDADGVHVGQLDGSAASVRARVGEHRILGRSTHDATQIGLAMEHADYVAFGPVFSTANVSRPKGVRGLDSLAAAAARVDGRMPLVAIGGITRSRLADIVEAGATAWAVIGAISAADDPVSATRALLAP